MQTGRGQVIHFHFQNRSDRRLHTTYYMTCTQLEMTGHVCPRPAEPCISGTLATLAWLACQGLSTKTLSATTYKQLTHPDTDLFFWFQIQITVRRASLYASRRQTSQFSLDHCESVTPPLSHRHRCVAATLRAGVSCFIAIPPPTLCFTSSSFLLATFYPIYVHHSFRN